MNIMNKQEVLEITQNYYNNKILIQIYNIINNLIK